MPRKPKKQKGSGDKDFDELVGLMDQIALKVAKRLIGEAGGMPLDREELAAFGKLVAYCALKVKLSGPDDDEGKGQFGGHFDALTGRTPAGRRPNGTTPAADPFA